MSRLRPLHWIAILLFVPILALSVAISGVFPYSRLHCWTDDVDIRTGRIRHQRYLLTIQTSEETEDSWITESLDPDTLKNMPPRWKRANTFSPLHSTSADHTFNGTIEQIQTLADIHANLPFDPDARRTAARRVLGQWRNGGPDRAQPYVDALEATAEELAGTPATSITTRDLP